MVLNLFETLYISIPLLLVFLTEMYFLSHPNSLSEVSVLILLAIKFVEAKIPHPQCWC